MAESSPSTADSFSIFFFYKRRHIRVGMWTGHPQHYRNRESPLWFRLNLAHERLPLWLLACLLCTRYSGDCVPHIVADTLLEHTSSLQPFQREALPLPFPWSSPTPSYKL